MIVEWGKWLDIEEMKDDTMAFVNFFSNKDFREKLPKAKDKNMWISLGGFLKENSISIIKVGTTIAAALA